MQFIDIHNHCTWGIDDGIQTLEECKELFEQAKEDGITSIIATPHFIPGRQVEAEIQEIKERMNKANALSKQYGINIYFGSEVMLNYDFLDMIENRWFYTLAESKYLLCEFNVREKLGNSQDVEDRLYELIIRGYVPVVAHVERYFRDGLNIERVYKWINMGCKIQVNRTSLLGNHGKQIQKNAFELIKNKMVHVVATDAHRAQGTRICKLSDVYEILKKRCGKENADLLLYQNPVHILKDEKLEEMKEFKKTFGFHFRKGA